MGSIDFVEVSSFFTRETVCCFTSDMDWAPEWAMEEMLGIFDELQVPLTPFITHHSEVVQERYGRAGAFQHVGLHPNFLPGSSHGTGYVEQIEFCQRLWPCAICFRSHCFFDSTQISREFFSRGFRYDSNLCLFLHPCCTPLRHESGLIRFPVFWEDDVHTTRGLPFEIDAIKRHLTIPGLKIFNFHPLSLVINTPTSEHCLNHRFLYNKTQDAESWRTYVFRGAGERTFLEDLVLFLKQRGVRVSYLDDVFNALPLAS